MAIKLIATYSKKLGLPGFSSHQFSVSMEAEIAKSDDVPGECERLYQLLQNNIDGQIVNPGFVPSSTYGIDGTPVTNTAPVNGNNGSSAQANGNGTRSPLDGQWKCSDKQRDLILELVDEHDLDKHEIEALTVERFGHGVRQLNKMEASGLIDELLEKHCQYNGNGRRRTAYAGNWKGDRW